MFPLFLENSLKNIRVLGYSFADVRLNGG